MGWLDGSMGACRCMQVAVMGMVERDGTFLNWGSLSVADVLSWYNMRGATTVIVPQGALNRCLEFRGQVSIGLNDPLDKVRHLWDEMTECSR